MNGMNKPSVKEWTNKNFLFLNNAALLDTFAFYNDKQSATVRYLRFTYLITVLTYLLTYLLLLTFYLEYVKLRTIVIRITRLLHCIKELVRN